MRLADAWATLLPHVREAILTLVDAGLGVSRAGSPGAPCPQKTSASLPGSDLEEVARRIAKECRRIVQACLREEEWQDAELEFVEMITPDARRAYWN